MYQYIHGQDIGYTIPKDYIIPYSPAHILEIGQTGNRKLIMDEIQLISEKTENLEVLFCQKSFVLFQEH